MAIRIESSAQSDPIQGSRWIQGRPQNFEENQTPQMQPKTPTSFSRM